VSEFWVEAGVTEEAEKSPGIISAAEGVTVSYDKIVLPESRMITSKSFKLMALEGLMNVPISKLKTEL